jgi:hypothetical protein
MIVVDNKDDFRWWRWKVDVVLVMSDVWWFFNLKMKNEVWSNIYDDDNDDDDDIIDNSKISHLFIIILAWRNCSPLGL